MEKRAKTRRGAEVVLVIRVVICPIFTQISKFCLSQEINKISDFFRDRLFLVLIPDLILRVLFYLVNHLTRAFQTMQYTYLHVVPIGTISIDINYDHRNIYRYKFVIWSMDQIFSWVVLKSLHEER